MILASQEFAPPPQPPDYQQVIDALEDARSIIKDGWAQHRGYTLVDGNVCYCIVAAITAASRTTQIRDAALHAARLALPVGFGKWSLEQFNDAPATVVGDVTWLLLTAKTLVRRAVAA